MHEDGVKMRCKTDELFLHDDLAAIALRFDCFGSDVHRLDMPHLPAVIADGSVGRELAHACNVDDGSSRPRLRIVPERADLPLRFDV